MSTKTIDTPQYSGNVEALPPRTWHSRLDRDWSSWTESRAIVYLVFAAAYIVPNVMLAHQKLLWDDEFFTLYLSKTASWSDLWRALSTGADQHPPSFYYLTHLIMKYAGTTNVMLRSTALFGFALACVCLYEIAREIVGHRWGAPAILLPLATPALYYATEARGYGLELGFITFSLLMWMWASDGKKRFLTVPALAIGLCLAVASHYYALLILFPLAVGEFVKVWQRRSIDFPICGALFAAVLPVLLFVPLILRAVPYSKTFWTMPPAWSQILYWYPSMLGLSPLILVGAAALILVFRIPTTGDWRSELPGMSLPVAIGLITTALLPGVGMIAAKLVTHAFTPRYFIAALPAALIILIWAFSRVIRNERVGPALACVFCLVLFANQWRDLQGDQISALRAIRSVAAILQQTHDSPIVVTNVTFFHKLSFYGQRDLANRLVYVADPHRSIRYLGHDTVDRGLLALVPWFPLRVVWWDEWWRAHSSSLVYGPIDDWNWLDFALPEIGTIELKNRDVSNLLLSVSRTNMPTSNRQAGDPAGVPMLFNELPPGGPSLCKAYMPADNCPVIDDARFGNPIVSYPELLIRK
ncbi:MAG TPA: glycosyltransferase family 39 protein [Candidatus Acidoferrales bacterium]